MSIVIVALPGAPSLSEETAQADRDCDERIKEYVRNELNKQPDIDTASIVHAIAVKETEIPGLPPGGGIHTKYVALLSLLHTLYTHCLSPVHGLSVDITL